MEITPSLLTVKQTSERTQLSESTVRDLIRRGDIKHIRIGRAMRVPITAIDEWEQTQLSA